MRLIKFFDHLEDRIRHYLSHWPVFYALIGIVGIVLTWRGVWHLADDAGLSAWLSFVFGVVILLLAGLLVAVAIGDEILISAWHGRRKINEVHLEDALTLADKVDEIKKLLEGIEKKLNVIKSEEEKIEREIDEPRS